LSLDAGGVKCLSSLRILREIMRGISPEDSPSADLPKPCDHFDLICGSEWGAVLALMLGRLKMGVQECIERFERIDLPEPSILWRMMPGYTQRSSRQLEALLRTLLSNPDFKITDELFEPNASIYDCKTTILATNLKNPRFPIRLRSYASKMDGQAKLQDCSICQAAMAAVSIPLELDPVNVDSMSCISASVAGFSNPSKEAFDEATRIWSPDVIKTIVSVGTGAWKPPVIEDPVSSSVGSGWAFNKLVSEKAYESTVHRFLNLLRDVATDPERVTEELYRDARILQFSCSRLNVAMGLESIRRLDWTKGAHQKIEEATNLYIQSAEVKNTIGGCSESLLLSPDEPRNLVLERGEASVPFEDAESIHSDDFERTQEPVSVLFDAQSVDEDSQTASWLKDFHSKTSALFKDSQLNNIARTKIAVLDTGIDATHPYISARWKRPSVSKSGKLLVDQGYVDFLPESKAGKGPIDTFGHGTHVAGIILQLAPGAELHIARVFEGGSFDANTDKDAPKRVAKAIRYAANEWGVNIISMSFGFETWNRDIYDAVVDAYKTGAVVFAAASNDGNRKAVPIAYPARELGLVFCINSATSMGRISGFNPPPEANRDNFSILGENVLSTWPEGLMTRVDIVRNPTKQDGTWKCASGTSVATPIAAAVAASIMQFKRMYQGNIKGHRKLETFGGIRQIFKSMSTPLEGFDNILPWKILDVGNFKQISWIYEIELNKF
jgi:hypothetical protein